VTVTGTTRAVAGEILVDRSNFARSQVGEIVVDISQLTTDDPSRDNAIRRAYLESARYPLARFSNATIVSPAQAQGTSEPLRFQLVGDLSVRDITRAVTWDVEAVIGEDVLTATATLPIKMSDFGVQPPSLAMLKVEDDVVITLRLVAQAAESETVVSIANCEITSGGFTVTEPIDEAPVRDKVGEGHVMHGTVRSSLGCAPIAGAKMIFWLTGPDGQYDDAHRGTVYTKPDGTYSFTSNFPGIYSARPVPHIHLHVSADKHVGIELEQTLIPGQTNTSFDIVLEAVRP
jgi:polyisoprenoid-binding protein YceI